MAAKKTKVQPKVQEIVFESNKGSLILATLFFILCFILGMAAIDSYSYNFTDGFIVGIIFTISFFVGLTCLMRYHKSRKIYIKEVTNGAI